MLKLIAVSFVSGFTGGALATHIGVSTLRDIHHKQVFSCPWVKEHIRNKSVKK